MCWLRFYTSWTLIVSYPWLFSMATGDLVIIRKVNKRDVFHKDRFNIRRSKCIDIRMANKCGFYGGFERSVNNPCKCHCPPRTGTIMKSNNQWRCIGNEILRQQEGCGIYLMNEASDSFIKILSGNNWQFFHAAAPGCKLSLKNVSYHSCNGTWTKDPNIDKYVDFIRRGFDQVARGYAYQIRIRRNRIVEGKLIKLYLDCTAFSGNPCILVKMKGKQNCFKRITSSDQIQVRKNFKKNAPLLTSTAAIANLAPSTHRSNSTLSSLLKKNVTNKMQVKTIRRLDMEITAVILTVTAVLLGLVVLGLAVNLCCSSTRPESYKGKHIFRRVQNHRAKGAQRLRTCSDATTASHSLTLKEEVSSDKLESSLQTLYYDSRSSLSGAPSFAHQQSVS